MRLHRGFILWVGLTFFSLALILVAVFHNLWTIKHMGVLANARAGAGRLDRRRARKTVHPRLRPRPRPRGAWTSPDFLSVNMVITSVWASAFSANALLAWMKMESLFAPDIAYEIASYALLLATALFTQFYPAHAKRRSATPT